MDVTGFCTSADDWAGCQRSRLSDSYASWATELARWGGQYYPPTALASYVFTEVNVSVYFVTFNPPDYSVFMLSKNARASSSSVGGMPNSSCLLVWKAGGGALRTWYIRVMRL